MAEGERKRKGKKQRKKKAKIKKGLLYDAKGEKIIRKRKECPKCGAGVFLAEHKDRFTCGYCHYTEWKKQ